VALAERLVQLLREASAEILEAQKPIRVLRSLAWPEDVERRFFSAKGKELPRPAYRVSSELATSLERFRALGARLGGQSEVERFLRDTCASLATAARMLGAVGTKQFYFHSVELYGRPASLSSDRKTTNLDLARHFDQVIAGFAPPLEEVDRPTITAEEAAAQLAPRFAEFFGRQIRVVLVDGGAANASASAEEIKIKRGARFSARDLRQIEFHEGQVHVATALNGRAQPVTAFIGAPSPRTTSTQEGLAVLTEFLTRSTSLSRIRRLSDRTLAIQMAEEGADFLDLYRFFLGRGHDEAAAFDGARRVCRGGLVEGGAPFTKDCCYLDGLLRVTNFLRIALVKGQTEYVRLLFAGKLAVEDVPLFDRLLREGLVQEPAFTPAWAQDLTYLTAFMGYAAFLGECDLSAERRRYDDQIARAEDLDHQE
jgi:uncharacterized protein (TIGR02421 family)